MRLIKDQRGAATVEFIIAILPMFIFFLALWQYAYMQIAQITVQHASVAAARAAAVILWDDPKDYDNVVMGKLDGKRKDHVAAAAQLVLTAMPGLVLSDVKLVDNSTSNAAKKSGDVMQPNDMLRVEVDVVMVCDVPGSKSLYCAPLGAKLLKAWGAFPSQGANFTYADDDSE